MGDRRVVVKDHHVHQNLYRVNEYDGTYYVYRYQGGGYDDTVGQSSSLRDALELIKAHSGGDMLEIGDW